VQSATLLHAMALIARYFNKKEAKTLLRSLYKQFHTVLFDPKLRDHFLFES
jgi:hypothetical protein